MDSRRILDFEQQLKRQLAGALPGPMVQRQLAPELAFGRHRGPVPASARQAAVLLLVHPSSSPIATTPSEARGAGSDQFPINWSITAIVRPQHMKFHPGQIALPGGILEPGETPIAGALREFEEELGVPATAIRVLGHLTSVYVFASDAEVSPFVALADEVPAWRPNPAEVDAILEIPLSDLLKPAVRGSHRIRRGRLTMQAPHFAIAERQVWGATAMILAEFAAICSAATMHLRPEPPQPTADAT